MSGHISWDPADTERYYVSPVADPMRLIPHWACCGGRCDDTHTASCPVQSRNEPYVLGMLLGIRRELDQWNGEHRCYSRLGWARVENEGWFGGWICVCGSKSNVDIETQYVMRLDEFSDLFACRTEIGAAGLVDYWHASPGTTLERTP